MNNPEIEPGLRPGQALCVQEVAVYRGPHLYSRTKMVRIQLDLGRVEQYPTNLLPGFVDALLKHVPGLREHGCSYGEPGGLVLRMEEGTWLGHVAEHVAIELQNMAGADVARGKTRSVTNMPGVYNVMFEYENEDVGLLAGRFALELVNLLLPIELQGLAGADMIAPSPLALFAMPEALRVLRAMHSEIAFGPTTASIVREAEARSIPWRRLDNSSLVQLGYGKHLKRIRASCSSLTSEVAAEIAGDKELTNRLLTEAGLPAPLGIVASSAEEAVEAARTIGLPVVIKPVDGNHGRGVNIGLSTHSEVEWGFEQARAHSSLVLVEQQFVGGDHRILVIGGKLVAAAKRVPAQVVGDGRATIAQLIDRKNEDPRRGNGHESALTRISIDECLIHYIARSGYTLASVPEWGKPVMLLPTANLSTGGTAIDCTEDIHPDNALIACRAARILGLDIAGIDFVAPDIRKSVLETGGGIIEVNAGPGFRMHLYPSQGKRRNVAAPVLDLLYPPGAPSRVPVLAVTGTNGKTTTTRMLAHILAADGQIVGMTSSNGVYIDGRRILEGDCTGPRSARVVLGEPTIDVAVLETARGGLLREGLAFDACDIGCVTNVTADHLGLRGVHTVEDLAAVKSVVVEAVHENGWSILNADDPRVAAMREEAGGHICYFSTKAPKQWPDFLKDHVLHGGRALGCDLASGPFDMILYDQAQKMLICRADEIPSTMNGMAAFNVENALAASAMAVCNDVPLPVISEALRSFGTSYEQSAGRLNMVEREGVRIIVDYAHNPGGLRALGGLVRKLRTGNSSCIGVVGIGGDRRDQDIFEMGEIAASLFDRLILKEDYDLRGRSAGEVAAILRQGALKAGFDASKIEVVLREHEAVERALGSALNDDLIVVTADDIARVWARVSAPPANELDPLPYKGAIPLQSEIRVF
ncbi:cyanophycin synthetase [Rhizobium laguerreae]|uniref:cyanophycin synthetase n=1 Tax=Rhizobium laguerreae TaxID=1076926 RepID=UPI001C910C32|nr:cyanophycin synthetase [Rhizobium laguerreae]MBY3266860.1 cyanophycin synthetase [Rhizobium laguerreae]